MSNHPRRQRQPGRQTPKIYEPSAMERLVMDRVSANDRSWFEQHPDADARLRSLLPGENLGPGTPTVLVLQVGPGARLRQPIEKPLSPHQPLFGSGAGPAVMLDPLAESGAYRFELSDDVVVLDVATSPGMSNLSENDLQGWEQEGTLVRGENIWVTSRTSLFDPETPRAFAETILVTLGERALMANQHSEQPS